MMLWRSLSAKTIVDACTGASRMRKENMPSKPDGAGRSSKAPTRSAMTTPPPDKGVQAAK